MGWRSWLGLGQENKLPVLESIQAAASLDEARKLLSQCLSDLLEHQLTLADGGRERLAALLLFPSGLLREELGRREEEQQRCGQLWVEDKALTLVLSLAAKEQRGVALAHLVADYGLGTSRFGSEETRPAFLKSVWSAAVELAPVLDRAGAARLAKAVLFDGFFALADWSEEEYCAGRQGHYGSLFTPSADAKQPPPDDPSPMLTALSECLTAHGDTLFVLLEAREQSRVARHLADFLPEDLPPGIAAHLSQAEAAADADGVEVRAAQTQLLRCLRRFPQWFSGSVSDLVREHVGPIRLASTPPELFFELVALITTLIMDAACDAACDDDCDDDCDEPASVGSGPFGADSTLAWPAEVEQLLALIDDPLLSAYAHSACAAAAADEDRAASYACVAAALCETEGADAFVVQIRQRLLTHRALPEAAALSLIASISDEAQRAAAVCQRLLDVKQVDTDAQMQTLGPLCPAEYAALAQFIVDQRRRVVGRDTWAEAWDLAQNLPAHITWSSIDGPHLAENMFFADCGALPDRDSLKLLCSGPHSPFMEAYRRVFNEYAAEGREGDYASSEGWINKRYLRQLAKLAPYPAAQLLPNVRKKRALPDQVASAAVRLLRLDAKGHELLSTTTEEDLLAWSRAFELIRRTQLDRAAQLELQLFALELSTYVPL